MQWFADLLLATFKWIFSWFWEFLKYLYDGAMEVLGTMISDLIAQVPESVKPQFDAVVEILSVANYWLPINETFLLLGALFAFWTAFIVFKYSWRLVPFFH